MDLFSYTTMRDWNRRVDPDDRLAQDIDQFYRPEGFEASELPSPVVADHPS